MVTVNCRGKRSLATPSSPSGCSAVLLPQICTPVGMMPIRPDWTSSQTSGAPLRGERAHRRVCRPAEPAVCR